jgi:type VI secretion system secreted protein VgrG
MSTRTMSFDLELGIDQPFSLVSCKVFEGISELTRAEVIIAARDELDVSSVLTTPAIVRIRLDGLEARKWTLKVGALAFRGVEQDSLRFQLDLHDPLWLLRFTQNTRKFRNLTTEAIVSKVLTECNVPFAWKTTRPCDERNYCVQYHETNLAFVSRLLEFEGIFSTTDPDGTLIFADASGASPELPGTFDLLDASGALDRDSVGVHDFRRGNRVTSGKSTVNDWDWKKPQSNLIAAASADGDTDLEVYEYPTGYRNVGQGSALAKLRVEALRAGASFVEGRGNAPSFAPAHLFTFDGGEAFAGDYLLTKIEHEMHTPGFDAAGATTYENRFHAIPRAVPFRPPLITPQPTIAGNHTAMVRGPIGEEIHTDKYGRFRAQFHWDREAKSTDEDSRWMRMLQESATSMTLARVGWEVSAGYIDGDPDRPIGIARHINGVMTPTYGTPSNQTRMTIRTPTYPGGGGYNELRMEDVAGAMHMDVRAERDLNAKVENDKTETIGNNETHIVSKSFEHNIDRHQRVHIGAVSNTTVNKEDRLTVLNDRTMVVGASEDIDVKKEYTVAIGKNDTEKVGGSRITVAGSFQVNVADAKDVLAGVAKGAIAGAGFGAPIATVLTSAVSGALDGGAAGAIAGVMTVHGAGGGGGAARGGGNPLGSLLGSAGVLGSLVGNGAGANVIGAVEGVLNGGSAASAVSGLLGGGGAVSAVSGLVAGGSAASAVSGLLGGSPAGAALGSLMNGGGAASLAGAAKGAATGALSSATHGLSEGITLDKLIDTFCSGSIDRSTTKHLGRMVGGAYVALSLGNITNGVGFGYAETVGGAKLTVAGEGIGQTVGGPLATTVGGLVMRKAKSNMSTTAEKTVVRVGASATFSSEERIEIHGEEIYLEAETELTFGGGGMSMTLAPGKLSIEGKMKLDAGDKIVVTGNKDILT